MTFPVFDLHCDTALALLGEHLDQSVQLRSNNGHWDITRADQLSGVAQCFACFTTPDMQKWYGKSAIEIFEMQLARLLYEIERNSDRIAVAYSPSDLESNLSKGIISALLTIEGPAGFDFDPQLLPDLYKIGFRMTTLGWNESNPLTGSHMTGEGLSQQGREYVKQAQKVGMLVDVSHISDQGFWDVVEISNAPIVASHSNSRAVWNISRNLTDDMFLALCATGGVAGINLYSDFLGETPDLNTVADHIIHFMELDPSGKHIALGGDLDGCESLPQGFSGVQDYTALADCLSQRGVASETIHDIFWNNAFGVMNYALHFDKK